MSKRITVRNLSYNTTEERLMQAFAAWGPTSVTLARDEGSQSKGFGFVEIAEDDQARLAVAAMHGKKLDGLDLMVREARPPREVLGCSRRAAATIVRGTKPVRVEGIAAHGGCPTLREDRTQRAPG
jgi:cold-inducible RNA-binding protein